MSKNLLTVVMLASFLLQCLLGVGEAAVVPTSLVSIHNGATVDGPGQISNRDSHAIDFISPSDHDNGPPGAGLGLEQGVGLGDSTTLFNIKTPREDFMADPVVTAAHCKGQAMLTRMTNGNNAASPWSDTKRPWHSNLAPIPSVARTGPVVLTTVDIESFPGQGPVALKYTFFIDCWAAIIMVERIQWIDSPERRDWHVLLRPSDLMFFAYKAARPYDTTDAGRTNRQPKSVNYIAFKVGNDPDRQIIRRFYRHLGDELQRAAWEQYKGVTLLGTRYGMTVGWMVTEHEGVHAGEEHRQDEPLLFHVPIADHVWACGEEGDGEEPRDLCIGFKLRGR